MDIDFRRLDAASLFETDICIIGSGAAGLVLAAQLAGLCRLLIVEAGDRQMVRGRDDWLIGETESVAFDGFEAGRRRVFGGATRAWAGQARRLDAIDFEPRDWVPHSGWPITADELAPFYDRAEQMLGLGKPVYDAQLWRRAGREMAEFNDADVTPQFTVYLRQPDFTRAFGNRLVRDNPSVTLLRNATVTGIMLNNGGVSGLQLRGEGDRQAQLRARCYVLCGGGIENPRLLLASGVGNANDLVGRFFQDHPSGTTGIVTAARRHALVDQFRKFRSRGLLVWPKLALTEAAQRRGHYLNANALMLYEYDEGSALTRAKAALAAAQARSPAMLAREGLRLLRHIPELAGRGVHSLATGLAPMFTPSRVLLKAHVEQVPDPANRIRLANTTDRFGVPRPRLEWRVHELELRTLRGITELVGEEFARLGFGTMQLAGWLDRQTEKVPPALEDTYHHAGTTRMARTATEGVVDTDCRVFGIDNLYIAGSSVFPTSGYANPTLTIIALAIRLADLLKRRHGAA